MMRARAHASSIKKRLLWTLLAPLCVILVALGISGAWLVQRNVENSSDRVLSGSLQAIGETLAMQEGYITLDLPPSALGMLENADRDNVYYSVIYRGKVITGYPELKADQNANSLENIRFRDGIFHGVPIRIAMEAKLVPQLDSPIIVQVAETTKNRRAVAQRMMIYLTASELFLLSVIASLIVFAVDWGLKPLAALRRTVEARIAQPELDFAPLPLKDVPQDVLPFVSAFNTLLRHVEATFDTLRRFTSDASHQLRAPLAVVRTHVELLERRAQASPEVQTSLGDISQAVKALQRLIVQLISLAKAERPSDRRAVETFDLVECTAAASRAYAARAFDRGMELSFESDQERLLVYGSPVLAGEMIANLLDNCVRYGLGGGHIVIRIPNAQGRLEIEDDGPGIPPDQRERVFERFYRLPHNSDSEGSGLGLSIVQALGKRLGATIGLEAPASGRGVRAVIQFQCI
jgi:two-component system sensor histidine kinase TctE